MSSVPTERNYLGIVDGVHVWEVIRTDTGETIGWDTQVVEEVADPPSAEG